jgi:hypothetical protein
MRRDRAMSIRQVEISEECNQLQFQPTRMRHPALCFALLYAVSIYGMTLESYQKEARMSEDRIHKEMEEAFAHKDWHEKRKKAKRKNFDEEAFERAFVQHAHSAMAEMQTIRDSDPQARKAFALHKQQRHNHRWHGHFMYQVLNFHHSSQLFMRIDLHFMSGKFTE